MSHKFAQNSVVPFYRRDMLLRSGLGLGALGLSSLLADDQQLENKPGGPHFLGRAKRVIQFFLNGGPSHVDTFDPKPALHKYAGQRLDETLTTERKTGAAFPSPFKFRPYGESGIEVSEIFSRTAQHIDEIAVIRSMYAQVPNHEPSLLMMNTGHIQPGRPAMGSWLTYGLGSENQDLPGFVVLCPNQPTVVGPPLWSNRRRPSRIPPAKRCGIKGR